MKIEEGIHDKVKIVIQMKKCNAQTPSNARLLQENIDDCVEAQKLRLIRSTLTLNQRNWKLRGEDAG